MYDPASSHADADGYRIDVLDTLRRAAHLVEEVYNHVFVTNRSLNDDAAVTIDVADQAITALVAGELSVAALTFELG